MQRHHPNTQLRRKGDFIGYVDANRYKIKAFIGRGTYGIVYSAVDVHTNEKVAIKEIPNVFKDVPQAVQFLREIKLLRLLQHPNIVKIKSILVPPSSDAFNDIFVVFELMDSNLTNSIRFDDNLTPQHHRKYMHQILCALKFMHAANVYHLDLKPDNVLVNENSQAKLCDLGLSRVAFSDPSTVWRNTGYVVTRPYRAPEICGSEYTKYPYALDIWSTGCIFAEIVTGKLLFPGKNNTDQLDLITNLLGTPSVDTIYGIHDEKRRKYLIEMKEKSPVPFAERFPNLDPLALELLQKLLAFDPKDRPTAEQALADSYFRGLQEINSNPSQPISKDEFAFESCDMSEMEIRELMYDEILKHHPQSQVLQVNLPQAPICYAPVYYYPGYGYYLVFGGKSWLLDSLATQDIYFPSSMTGEASNAISGNVLSTSWPSFYEPTAPLLVPSVSSSRNVAEESVQNLVPLQRLILPYETSSRNITGESVRNEVPQQPLFPSNAMRPGMNVNQEQSVTKEGKRLTALHRQPEDLNIKPRNRKEDEQHRGLGLPYTNSSRHVSGESSWNQATPQPLSPSNASMTRMEVNQVNTVTEGNREASVRQLPNLRSTPHDRIRDKKYSEA